MRRHELDPVSLVFGFAFTALGLVFLFGGADQALRLRWVWPLLLLGLGAGILVDLARSNRRDPDQAEHEVALEDSQRDLEPDSEPPPSAPEPPGTGSRVEAL
jgi:hypothetical protein